MINKMKLSTGFWQTYKEAPQDAEIVSHRLMVRAGLIQRASSGLYNYLPMGLRSIQKIEQIVREEHNKAGMFELTMTVVTPGGLWKETKRWDKMGDLMLKFQDKRGRDLCLSPTNEEAIVDIFRRTVKSYKQLPIGLYQINTKYRDEIRPRYGLMRCCEFIMKDAYSFVLGEQAQEEIYQKFYNIYSSIFSKMQLHFIPVEADAGTIGSAQSKTHEFQVIADSGEDEILYCESGKYAANIEKAKTQRPDLKFDETTKALEKVETKNKSTMSDVCDFLKIPQCWGLKALLYTTITGKKENHVAAFTLGDDTLNEVKLKNYLGVDSLSPTTMETIQKLGLPAGYIGPVGPIKMDIIFDQTIDLDAAYVVGAMEENYHYKNYVPIRDSKDFRVTDLRMAQVGDICLETGRRVLVKKGIEVGHIFQLGDHYTKAMNALVQDREGRHVAPLMGCYGIGITRIISASIEQNHDDHGIIWPKQISPYHVYFGVISKSPEIIKLATELYQKLWEENVETILDDRRLGAGFMFKDSDLLGLPLQIVLGERDFKKNGMLEIKVRRTGEKFQARPDELIHKVKKLLADI